MSEAELGENRAGRHCAEVFYEVLPEKPHRDRIDENPPLSVEPEQTTFGVDLQEILDVQVIRSHPVAPPISMSAKVHHSDWICKRAQTRI